MTTTRDRLETLGVAIQEDVGRKLVLTEVPSLAALTALEDSNGSKEMASSDLSWYTGGYFKTLDAAREAITLGMPPSKLVRLFDAYREGMESKMDEIASAAPSAKRRRVLGDDGDELDLGRYLDGDPACWGRMTAGRTLRRIVIGIQSCYVASADAAIYAKAAAMGTAASDLFERLGYAVEVCSVGWHNGGSMPGTRNSFAFHNMVALKTSDQKLDPQALLVTGIPAYSRLLEFSVWDSFAEPIGKRWNASQQSMTPATLDALGVDVLVGYSLTASGGFAEDLRGVVASLDATYRGEGA